MIRRPLKKPTKKTLDSISGFLYYVEMQAKDVSLGDFEHLILLAVMRLGDDAYGMKVRREIADRTGRDVAIGAVYATLDRLAEKNLVKSTLGEPTAERGGRAKRTFRMTSAGLQAVERTQEHLRGMVEGLRVPLARGGRIE
jgi:PadR family transcriptional regulator PadR